MANPARPPARSGMTITLEEFLALAEEEPSLEYIDGRIEVKVSPQKGHSLLTVRLVERLNPWALPRRLGLALPELCCTFSGRSIVRDVVFLTRNHLDFDERGWPIDQTTWPPDIDIEIISPDQGPTSSRSKLTHSTANGCALGWWIDTDRMTMDLYGSGGPPVPCLEDGWLEGEPILPGFRLPFSEVFGWLVLGPRLDSES